jgi:hypothetical protein
MPALVARPAHDRAQLGLVRAVAPLDEALVVGERFARLLDDVGERALPDNHHDGELGVAPGACEEHSVQAVGAALPQPATTSRT